MSPGHPFVLSLSKDCTSCATLEKERSFDRLRTNGLGAGDSLATHPGDDRLGLLEQRGIDLRAGRGGVFDHLFGA